jgi:hypothetical protein
VPNHLHGDHDHTGGSGGVDRDEVLARVDLEALLDSLSGPAQRHRWRCPDPAHPDEHPSVTVRTGNDGVARWRCWSGGHGGTAIDAVIAAHHLDVGGALRWLAVNHAHLPATEQRPRPPIAPPGRPDPAVGDYARRAAQLLWTAGGARQRAWLTERGLHEAVLRANRVGADPGRRFLPRPRGMPGGWPAVIYPALTPTGDVAYLQARYLTAPDGRDKYDNPSAALAANPRLAWTVPVGEPRSGLVVCEGTADALVAAQAGFRSVGVLGATYPDARVADGISAAIAADARLGGAPVVVCFDADTAGRAGGAQLVGLLAARHVEAVVVTPPDGCDLTVWAQTDPTWATHVAATTTETATVDAAAVAAVSAQRPALTVLPSRSLSLGGLG